MKATQTVSTDRK